MNRSRSEIIDLNEKLTKDDDLGEDPLETTPKLENFEGKCRRVLKRLLVRV